MEKDESQGGSPRNDDEALAERVAGLENRIARLEKEMESIGKMENALSNLLGGKKSD